MLILIDSISFVIKLDKNILAKSQYLIKILIFFISNITI